MLDAIKRWLTSEPPPSGWEEIATWAKKQGFPFKTTKDGDGFVIEGSFADRPWRLEWGPPQRSYITTHELRIRMELGLPASMQMLLMSRSLMETLERETFERYTEGTQTQIDVSTPEEMRWLAMFPKAAPAFGRELRALVGVVANDPQLGVQWTDGLLTQRLEVVAKTLLLDQAPLLMMTLRGRLYLRHELPDPRPAPVAAAIALFDAGAQAAVHALETQAEGQPGWQSTASTAWQTHLDPEDKPPRG